MLRQVMEVNLIVPDVLSRWAMSKMATTIPSGGRIISIGSIACESPRLVPYTTSKCALSGLSRALSIEGRNMTKTTKCAELVGGGGSGVVAVCQINPGNVRSAIMSTEEAAQAPRRLRKIGYLLTATLSLLSLNSFAIYTHYHDEIFYSYYPFPVAFDVGYGPSMLPTIRGGDGNDNNLYLRDCWSHRFLWLDYEHCKKRLLLIFSHDHDNETETRVGESDNPISVASSSSSFNRPWQNGDIVTFYNPYTKTLVTKRIIGVGGDYVCALGEYARELYNQQQQQQQSRHDHDAHVALDDNYGVVVPHDARFPIPFSKMIPSSQSSSSSSLASSSQIRLTGEDKQQQQQQDAPQWYKNAIIQVPPHHVWLEGDNPLHSTDSRHYGPIPESALRGRVVRRLWPLGTDPIIGSIRPLPPSM